MVEFTGERVIPGQVDPDLLNEHLARYVFASRLARGRHVLDAGCGAGYGSAELMKTAASVVGVDNSAEALAYAREHYRLPGLHFAQASVTALPHADAAFDLIVAFEVIEHLEQWRAFLAEVRRVLAPAGQFVVSTPNKLYYGESRGQAGANPFHTHEFEFTEFRNELAEVFPYISLFLENHVAGVAFRPVQASDAAEVRVDGAPVLPAESHFFVAVCAHYPPPDNPTFVYVPSAGNVLRERETHIALLSGELRQKDAWLQTVSRDLADLDARHRRLTAELEEANRWAQRLNTELAERGARVLELQQELAREQDSARQAVAALEAENLSKTDWANHLNAELDAKLKELAQCVEYLHAAENTVAERTAWAQQSHAEVERLRAQLALVESSRWFRLGRRAGLGPDLQP